MAKIQNLFNLEDEFTPTQFSLGEIKSKPLVTASIKAEGEDPFLFPTHSSKESNSFEKRLVFTKEQEKKANFFILPSHLWSTLQSDESFAAEIRKVIDREVEQRIEKQSSEAIAKRLAEAELVITSKTAEKEKEGYEAGLLESKTKSNADRTEFLRDAEELKKDLQQCIQNVIQEKQKLLDQHQRVWIDALSILMKKFLIKNAGQVEVGIQNWLQTQVTNFSAIEKLKLFIPESQFERMEKMGISPLATEFDLMKDKNLNNGEFRVEAKSGGLFFSSQQEMKKLEDLLAGLNDVEKLERA